MDKEKINQNMDDTESGMDETFSLESILAEYKGTAYIDGDKRTPSDILDAKTEQIVQEVANGNLSETLSEPAGEPNRSEEDEDAASAAVPDKEPKESAGSSGEFPKDDRVPDHAEEPAIPAKQEAADEQEQMHGPPKQTEHAAPKIDDDDVRFFETFDYASKDAVRDYEEEVAEAVTAETADEEVADSRMSKFFSLFNRDKGSREDAETEEIKFEEPDYLEASKELAKGVHPLAIRTMAAILICILMAVFTFLAEGGTSLPFGIGSNLLLLTGILLIMLLIVMILGIDLLIKGLADLFTAEPGGESLVAVSCVVTAVAAFYTILTKNDEFGLPFCVVAAWSLMFAMWGELIYRKAMIRTLRSAVAAAHPYGVSVQYGQLGQRTILKKDLSRTEGFYNNLVQADVCERTYTYAAPLLLIAALLFAILASIGRGMPQNFAHSFAAIISISASFSVLLAFPLPFSLIARRVKQSGAAIAGWAGACDIFYSEGVLVTDDDIFPAGTISINGVKVFEEIAPEKAIKYTASLIIASGSGLARPFDDLTKGQGMGLVRLDDFTCYEGGGIGAIIRGEHVLTGTAGFMNLMGIRIPSQVNLKNSVFTAIGDKLVAIFSVNYVPVNSVRGALMSILGVRISMLFAMRDFNITPLMLQQKFKVSMDGIEYIPIQDSYMISDESPPGTTSAAAVLCREGLWPFAEAITNGRQLKTVSQLTTILTLISSVVGVLVMFYLCWKAAFDAATAGHVLIYMISVQAAVFLVSNFVRRKN